ncbi:MAG: c-type cytochrome domain-containing protein [Planctomycetota bacterium]
MITEQSLLQLLGRLHPLVLHLPIGLWVGVFVLEFGGALIRRPASRATVATLTWLAAIGTALSALTGWYLALEGGYPPRSIELHRWLGIGSAAVCMLGALLSMLRARGPFRLLLLVGLIGLGAAGHIGSTMTHGADWLTEPFEEPREPPTPVAVNGAATGADPADPAPTTPPTRPALPTFAAVVQPILVDRCGKCHGETKSKGDLALHTAKAIAAGGETGPVLVAGRPDDSELVLRIALPLDDDDHMPPEDKPQPTADEVALLRAWIAAGAPFEGEFDPNAPTAPTEVREPPAAPAPAPDPDAGSGDGASLGTPDAVDPSKDAAPSPPPAAEPPDPAPVPAPQPEPDPPADPAGEGDGAATEPAARRAVETRTIEAGALAALRERLVHVEPLAQDSPLLWVDFAPVATEIAADDLPALLLPLAARIADLGLARTRAGDAVLAHCAAMPNLNRLDLRATAVTGAGVGALRGHPHLAELVLAETAVDDSAVDALLALPALRTVHLWRTAVTAEGLARLRTREGLTVDAGEVAAEPALETEPPPELRKASPAETPTADPPAAEAPVAATPVADALQPVNDACPVSGKPIDPRYVIVHEQRAVAFCCPNCPAAFWRDPAAHPVVAR